MKAVVKTNFSFPKQKSIYVGKVRDVYNIDDKYMAMVVSDRISAFDVVLPKGIPYKGQVLNQIASKFLDATADIVPNWKMATPDPMVTVGLKCEGFRVEMIVRGYLAGVFLKLLCSFFHLAFRVGFCCSLPLFVFFVLSINCYHFW